MNRPHSQAEMPSLFSVELPSFLVGIALKLKCPHFLALNCPHFWWELPSS